MRWLSVGRERRGGGAAAFAFFYVTGLLASIMFLSNRFLINHVRNDTNKRMVVKMQNNKTMRGQAVLKYNTDPTVFELPPVEEELPESRPSVNNNNNNTGISDSNTSHAGSNPTVHTSTTVSNVSGTGASNAKPKPTINTSTTVSNVSGTGGSDSKPAVNTSIANSNVSETGGSDSKPAVNTSIADSNVSKTGGSESEPLKYIWYYSKYWDATDFDFGEGRIGFEKHDCPVRNCYATSNRNHLGSVGDFDAVLFHGPQTHRPPDEAKWRKPHQRFVYFSMESPAMFGHANKDLDDMFNWTMTHRLDSDLPREYGWVEPINSTRFYARSLPELESMGEQRWPVDYDEHAFAQSLLENETKRELLDQQYTSRPKTTAWVVSNCVSLSRREQLATRLKHLIGLTKFGKKCNGIPCGPNDHSCTPLLLEHKFYLSFENSFARDYVTEKLYYRMEQGFIPIVLGQANYSLHIPPHSYINALDFESLPALAEYITEVASNKTLYQSYFWWRDHYKVVSFHHTPSYTYACRSICQLCEWLHQDNHPPKIYHDFVQWWQGDAHIDAFRPRLEKLLESNSTRRS